jgi:hypothetical protein
VSGGVHGQEHSACGGKVPPGRRRRSSRGARDHAPRPGTPRPSLQRIGTGRASQQPVGPVLVGGIAGEPCGEPWTVGRLAALTVPNHATEA